MFHVSLATFAFLEDDGDEDMKAGDAKEFKEKGKANPVMWLMNNFLEKLQFSKISVSSIRFLLDKPYSDSNEHESRHRKKLK